MFSISFDCFSNQLILDKTVLFNQFGYSNQSNMIILNDKNISKINPNTFTDLTNLVGLYLQNNELTSLESSIFNGLNKLEELHLNNNKLTFLDSDTFKLTNLKVLLLNDNNLKNVISDIEIMEKKL